MKLHDRIMALEIEENISESYQLGYGIARLSAAQVATEADLIMAKMSSALQHYAKMESAEGDGIDYAQTAFKHYQEYVK